MSGTESQWYKDAIFYEVYPRGFHDANGDGDGDLAGLITKLDYLQDLGIDCLWLMPIYASPLKVDGYDIADFRQIHPTIGTVADFECLPLAAHARGVSASLPTSSQSIRPTSTRPDIVSQRDPGSPKSESGLAYGATLTNSIMGRGSPRETPETSNWTVDPVARQYFWHRFFSRATSPTSISDNPMVKRRCSTSWRSTGSTAGSTISSGSDAVPYLIEPRRSANCENLPETHEFLKEMHRIRATLDTPDTASLGRGQPVARRPLALLRPRGRVSHGLQLPLMPRLFAAIRREAPAGRLLISSTRCPKSPRRVSGPSFCEITTSSRWKYSDR